MNNFHIARNVWPELSFLEEHHCLILNFVMMRDGSEVGVVRPWVPVKDVVGGFALLQLCFLLQLHFIIIYLLLHLSSFLSLRPLSASSVIVTITMISTCLPPHDLVLAGVQAAASISPPPVYESLIFSSVMHEIFTLPVSTISHVPRKVRPLLGQVIITELQHARLDGLWGFTRLSLFPKAVLRPPPRGGRKKRYAVDALIVSRIRRWQDGDLEALWLEARNDSSSRRAPSNVGDAVRGNVKRVLRLAREGRYSSWLYWLCSI